MKKSVSEKSIAVIVEQSSLGIDDGSLRDRPVLLEVRVAVVEPLGRGLVRYGIGLSLMFEGLGIEVYGRIAFRVGVRLPS